MLHKEWHDVIIKGDVEIDFIYDEVVLELLTKLSDIEFIAVEQKDTLTLSSIRQQKFSILSNAIPRIVIRDIKGVIKC